MSADIDVIKHILDLSKIKTKKSRRVEKVLNKCTEELGEMATVINKPHKNHPEALEFEVADLMLASVDLLYVYYRKRFKKFTEDELAEKIELMIKNAVVEKSKKWNNQLKKV